MTSEPRPDRESLVLLPDERLADTESDEPECQADFGSDLAGQGRSMRLFVLTYDHEKLNWPWW